MKSMVALAVLFSTVSLARCDAQVFLPGFYAPAYPYAPRTALDALQPSLGVVRSAVPFAYASPATVLAHRTVVAAPAVAAAAPAAVTFNTAHIATAPFAATHFAAAPIATAPAAAVTLKAAEDAVKEDTVIEIRKIFPVFGTDLRSGTETITFLRPDQINPVKAGDSVTKVETSELPSVIVPDFDLRSSVAAAPVIPAGIVQATQPRFITARAPVILA